MHSEETYMQRCLDLGRLGLGNVAPNPLVGCVIVKDDKIIGEGYHRIFGGPHAEVFAINAVKDKKLLKNSTLYVNLEPCSHYGKTPPCTDLIIKMKIPEVVIGQKDPNPLVAGAGCKKLVDAGCKVKTGILEKESRYLNRRFNCFHEMKRPYIILKWAQTLDGFMDIDRTNKPKISDYWISNYQLKRLVHKWRTEENGVLIGTTTAINDNPRLNAREWTGNDPLRVVIDENLIIPVISHVLDSSLPTLVFTAKNENSKPNLEYITIDFNKSVHQQVMDVLYKRNIQSVIVEGGRFLLESFLKINLWDEARVITGNKVFHKGLKGPDFPDKPFTTETFDEDRLLVFRNLIE